MIRKVCRQGAVLQFHKPGIQAGLVHTRHLVRGLQLHWSTNLCKISIKGCLRLLVIEDTFSSSAVQISRSILTENFDSLDWFTISQILKHDWMLKRKSLHHFFSQLLDVLLCVCLMSFNVFNASAVSFFRC